MAVDGGAEPGADATAERARAAGADVVLELPRGGKYRAQDAAVGAASGDAAGVLRRQRDVGARTRCARSRRRSPTREVGYACGQVRFVNEAGTNQEGLYWRYEMWLRAQRVGAGLGHRRQRRDLRRAPRGLPRASTPCMGHDLAFPFNIVKRGRRAVYVPGARRPRRWSDLEGEWARKRRMMTHAWPIVVRGGLLDPRGYEPLYALMIASHRRAAVRVAAAARARRDRDAGAAAARPHVRGGGGRAGGGPGGGVRGGRVRARPLLVARYYVLTTAALAAGLYDWLRHGTEVGWETPEGTR